jgi:hypothetical protein
MDFKYNSLPQYQTWILVFHPLDCSFVGCKWVYKIKYKIDETFDRYKTKLVAQGFTQVERIDYNETFSPVVNIISLCILLILGCWVKIIIS